MLRRRAEQQDLEAKRNLRRVPGLPLAHSLAGFKIVVFRGAGLRYRVSLSHVEIRVHRQELRIAMFTKQSLKQSGPDMVSRYLVSSYTCPPATGNLRNVLRVPQLLNLATRFEMLISCR
jgi:hypothetical protein